MDFDHKPHVPFPKTQPGVPRILSLFAGIGGIDIGFEKLGCKTVAYSEIDYWASRVMARRFPDAVNIGDIVSADFEPIKNEGIDIIVGGFPCQDISLANAYARGIEGAKSGLWRFFHEAIISILPKLVIVENVPALKSRGLDRVLANLSACGYDAEWDCVSAAAVGAPHLRERLFIIATRADIAKHGEAVSYPNSDGRGEGFNRDAFEIDSIRGSDFARRQAQAWKRPNASQQWVLEPAVDRVANGIPK